MFYSANALSYLVEIVKNEYFNVCIILVALKYSIKQFFFIIFRKFHQLCAESVVSSVSGLLSI